MVELNFEEYFYMYMPSMILVVGAIVILLANAFAHYFSRSTSLSLSLIFLIASCLFCFSVGHVLYVSNRTHIVEIIILVASFWFVFLTFSKYRFVEFQTPEFYPLYLLSVAGFMIMVNANNLILVFLGLELGSLPLSVLMAFNRRIYGIEAGIKYFLASALASVFFILGILFFYLYSGDFHINASIVYYKETLQHESIFRILLILFGISFMFAGIGFKISLVPWHTWMPDVYEGSNPVLAGYVSIVPKIAGFAVFTSMFGVLFNTDVSTQGYVENLLKIFIFITITIPNIMALLQRDIKRMLAFSSISHSGFALACIYLGSFDTLVLYWILFLITNLGAFATLWVNKPQNFHARFDYSLERFSGFGKKKPIIALGLAFFMIVLAGIPPFSIFWGKIFIVSVALERGEIVLAFVMMINSAIAACYYLKPIVAMFFKPPLIGKEEYEDNATLPIKMIIFGCVVLCVGSIFVVSYFFEYIPLLNI